MKFFFFLITSLSISFSLTEAQTDNSLIQQNTDGFINNLNYDLLSFYNTASGVFLSPFNFDEEDLILTGIIAGATALSFTLDHPVRNSVGTIESKLINKVTSPAEKFGNGRYLFGVSGVLYLGGHIFSDSELRKTGLMLAEAILLNAVITQTLKIATGRSRPFLNEGNFKLELFEMEFEDEENSFPSGHTSTAFAAATVISERINNIYASIAVYSFAGLTAFQRVYKDKHWVSDTILGAALGTIIGLKVVKLNSDNEKQDSAIDLNISPVVNSNGYGVGVVLKF